MQREIWQQEDGRKTSKRIGRCLLAGLALIASVSWYMSGCGSEEIIPGGAVVWWVIPTGQGDFVRIQECIASARDGDTCLVFPGTFSENLDFFGKRISVSSTGGPEVTVIDGRGLGPVVRFSNREDYRSVLSGFTIANGSALGSGSGEGSGGGIQILAASPRIDNCLIRDNYAEGDGGGVYCAFSGAMPSFNRVVFQNNTAAGKGGGLFSFSGSADLTNCLFLENEALTGGAIGASYGARIWLVNSTLADNQVKKNSGAEALYLFNASSQWTDSICGHKDWQSILFRPLVVLDRNLTDPSLQASSPTSLSLTNVDLEGGTLSIKRKGSCLMGICPVKNRHPVYGDPDFMPLMGDSEDPVQAYYLYQNPNEPRWLASPCVDSGSRSAEAAGMISLTTQNGEYGPQKPDTGTVDLGYHYAIVVE